MILFDIIIDNFLIVIRDGFLSWFFSFHDIGRYVESHIRLVMVIEMQLFGIFDSLESGVDGLIDVRVDALL